MCQACTRCWRVNEEWSRYCQWCNPCGDGSFEAETNNENYHTDKCKNTSMHMLFTCMHMYQKMHMYQTLWEGNWGPHALYEL